MAFAIYKHDATLFTRDTTIFEFSKVGDWIRKSLTLAIQQGFTIYETMANRELKIYDKYATERKAEIGEIDKDYAQMAKDVAGKES